MGQQEPNGWFANNCLNDPEAPLSHTIGYTLQGILEIGIAAQREDLIAAARSGVDPLLSAASLPRGFLAGLLLLGLGTGGVLLVSDGQCSACRGLLSALRESRVRTNIDAPPDSLLNYLKALQVLEGPDPGVNGAIGGSYPLLGSYMTAGYPNWATKYFLDGSAPPGRDCPEHSGSSPTPMSARRLVNLLPKGPRISSRAGESGCAWPTCGTGTALDRTIFWRRFAAWESRVGDVLLVHSSYDKFAGFSGKPSDAIRVLQDAAGRDGHGSHAHVAFHGTAVDYVSRGSIFDVRRIPFADGPAYRTVPPFSRGIRACIPRTRSRRGAHTADMLANHHLARTPCGDGSPFARLRARWSHPSPRCGHRVHDLLSLHRQRCSSATCPCRRSPPRNSPCRVQRRTRGHPGVQDAPLRSGPLPSPRRPQARAGAPTEGDMGGDATRRARHCPPQSQRRDGGEQESRCPRSLLLWSLMDGYRDRAASSIQASLDAGDVTATMRSGRVSSAGTRRQERHASSDGPWRRPLPDIRPSRPLRVASAFVAFPSSLFTTCSSRTASVEGLRIELYQAGFGQFRQDILNSASGLYAFDPHVVILAVEGKDLVPDLYRHDTRRWQCRARERRDGSRPGARGAREGLPGALGGHSPRPQLHPADLAPPGHSRRSAWSLPRPSGWPP